VTIDNKNSVATMYVYQLFLWVQYSDGLETALATDIVEGHYTPSPPPISARLLQQFGMSDVVVGRRELSNQFSSSPPPPLSWSLFQQGMPVPSQAYAAGMHEKFGSMFIGRSVDGLLGTICTTTGQRNGSCTALKTHARRLLPECHSPFRIWQKVFRDGLILTVPEERVHWLPLQKGEHIPMSAIAAGFEERNGRLFIGRSKEGSPLKLLEDEGRASHLWDSESGAEAELQEILAWRERKPVKAGAMFKYTKSLLPGEKIVMVVTSGNRSEASSRFRSSSLDGSNRRRTTSSADRFASRGSGGASASGGASGGATAGAEASASESLDAHLHAGLSASIGHTFWNWLIGGPTADMKAELAADFREALEAGAKVAASATVGIGAELALQFAGSFVGALASSSSRASASTRDLGGVKSHIHQMTNGVQETKVMDNSAFRTNLFVYQLHLWVEFDDGSSDEMGTLLMEASRDDQPPVPDAKLREQFGLFADSF